MGGPRATSSRSRGAAAASISGESQAARGPAMAARPARGGGGPPRGSQRRPAAVIYDRL